jgi:hypothetical protein
MRSLFKKIDYNEIKIKVFDGDRSVFKIIDTPDSALMKLRKYLEEKYP